MTEHDAIVVLGCATGGGFVSSGRAAKRGELRGAAARRVARAAAAYHAGAAPLVLACGGRRWDGVAEATAMAEALARADVPLRAIKVELVSLSTSENARFAAARLLPGSSRVVLVTCDWHMRRAERAFRNVGFAVAPAPATSPARGIVARSYLALREAASTAAEIVRGALRPRPPPPRLRVPPARERRCAPRGELGERGAVVARPDRDRGRGEA